MEVRVALNYMTLYKYYCWFSHHLVCIVVF